MTAAKRRSPLLAVDAAVFCALFAWYCFARGGAAVWPRVFHFPSSVMTLAMLLAAGAAGFVVHAGGRALASRDTPLAQRLLAVASLLWLTFLFLFAMEWGRLYLGENVHWSANPWKIPALGATYYALTGYQALHALAAAIWSASRAQYPQLGGLERLEWFTYLANAQFLLIAFGLVFASADLRGF